MGTEHEHAPRCPHGNGAGLATALGLPRGSIVATEERVIINFDALFEGSQDDPEARSGTFQGTRTNHGWRMYALGMFLLEEAGLTVFDPSTGIADAWKRLQAVTWGIQVKAARENGMLENSMLFPESTYGTGKPVNYAKTARAAQKKPGSSRPVVRRLLFAALLPQDGTLHTPGQEADLGSELAVWVRVGPRILARAWSNCAAARDHHKLCRPVLAIGMLSVRDRGTASKPVIRSRVEQLALIPVGPDNSLAPTPTSRHWHALEAALTDQTFYRVEPEEDAVFRYRCMGR
jgi:hypothetical protein